MTIPNPPGSPPRSTGGASGTPAVEQARQQVKGPAIGLLVVGILNWVILVPTTMVLTPIALAQQGQPPNITILIVMTSAFVISILVLVAALKMKRLQAYWLAVAASIMAIIISPANLIGLPIGIWVLGCVESARSAGGLWARECHWLCQVRLAP